MVKEYKINNKENYDNSAIKLMFLAMMVYAVSYFGRKSYDSNINEIMAFYGVSEASAGLVGTFFFAVYAIGQVFHGIMCKRYNPKIVVFFALITSAVCNFLVGIMPVSGFNFIKYIWFINGFAMASLWSVLIRLLNRTFSKKRLKQSLVFMAFPVSIGTFLIYGVSAFFSYIGQFKYTFFLASCMLIGLGVLWLLCMEKLVYKSRLERDEQDGFSQQIETKVDGKAKVKIDPSFYVLFGVLALFAIANNFVKDGLNTWTPTIFTDKFKLENWFAVLLAILLPLFGVLGAFVAILLHKKIKNYIVMCGVLYAFATIVLVALILVSKVNSWVLTLICFMLISALMASVNNVLTNIFPLQLKNGVDAGLIAGLIDGFCYIGSSISSFGLGSVAEKMGWDSINYIFTTICAICVLTVGVVFLVQKLKKPKQAQN